LLLLAGAALLGVSFMKSTPMYFRTFLVPYLIGTIISALTIGKPGSNVNYLLELAAALSISTVVVVDWLRRWPKLHLSALVLLICQVFGIVNWLTTSYFPSHAIDLHSVNPQIMQRIQKSDGPVLTDEYIGLLLLDHRPVYIQSFDFSILAENGTWDQQPFLDMLNAKFFELIIIYNPHDEVVRQRWTPQMLEHIYQNYQLVEQIDNNEIYRRRP
jgi:hypothetical protein